MLETKPRFGAIIAPFHPTDENQTVAGERDIELVQRIGAPQAPATAIDCILQQAQEKPLQSIMPEVATLAGLTPPISPVAE